MANVINGFSSSIFPPVLVLHKQEKVAQGKITWIKRMSNLKSYCFYFLASPEI